jgi:CRP/FNR family cyclic AMP-dependent transcriptional regulator
MSGESTLYDRFGSTFEAGAVIFREGDAGDEMYIIQSGKVRISKRIGDREQILAILEKGEFFGEMAIVTRAHRTATATAVDEVHVLAFNRDGFLSMINKNAKIALNIIDRLCQRLQSAHAQIQRLARHNARALVALNLHYGFQAAGWGQGEIAYDRTVGDIASTLEMPLDVVREHLVSLQADGAVRLEGAVIRLADRGRLEAVAEVQAARGEGPEPVP